MKDAGAEGWLCANASRTPAGRVSSDGTRMIGSACVGVKTSVTIAHCLLAAPIIIMSKQT